MKFKGTIIITDPCYIIKTFFEENPYPFPWTTDLINSPNIDEMIKQYTEWEDEHDDWVKCENGRNMEALGISTYFTEDTIYGDWGCTTYKVDTDPVEIIDSMAEAYANGDYEIDFSFKVSKIGNFCADAGLVAVFLLDEVRKYNPDIDKWIKEHPWCVTTIEDFDGNVEYYIDENSEAHIYGTGNINFFTTQTSL